MDFDLNTVAVVPLIPQLILAVGGSALFLSYVAKAIYNMWKKDL